MNGAIWDSILDMLKNKSSNLPVYFLLAAVCVLAIVFHRRAKGADDMRAILYTDGLTGYASYKALREAAPRLLGKEPARYALVYIDMHQFKYINDTLGYSAGNEILIAISHTLDAFVGPDERFARVYADKFVLLLKSAGQEALLHRLEELSGQLSNLRGGKFAGINFVFNCGVYKLGEDDCDIDMAYDRANYAKGAVQNSFSTTFAFYDELIRDRIIGEKWLESNMQPALQNGEFIPYYQPKVNVITGSVVGAEALARWNHPERGLLLPAEFIPFFEKNGFVVHVDLAIFTAACQFMRAWMDCGKTPVPVSVNFSRRHIMDPGFSDTLKAIADQFSVPCRLLEIEITETVAMDDLDKAVAVVESLKRHGFLISIDDYGTGYSSISFLQKLPLDVLKMDKIFVDNAMQHKKARDIMRHLVTAVRDNMIHVLCEGIETPEQRDFIVAQNCIFAQGYLFAAPLERVDFERYLEAAGAAAYENMDYVPASKFETYLRASAGDFIDRTMPGWVLGCYAEPDYPVFYISAHMLSLLGYSEAEFMHATEGRFSACMHPDDLTHVVRATEACCFGQEYSAQYRVRKKDGDYIWVRNMGKRIQAEGSRDALLSVCSDITDAVALREEREDLISALPGGVCSLLCAPGGPILLSATQGFYELIGRTQEEMEALNNRFFAIVHAADLPAIKKTIRRVTSGGTASIQCAFRVLGREGGVHWLSFRGAARNADEKRTITATCYNVDGEMRARQDAELVNAKLELALILSDHAVFEYDLNTRAIYEQSGLQELFSIAVQTENVPDSLIESGLVHPDDVPAFREKYQRIAAGEPHASCEVRMRSSKAPDGAPYAWMRTTFSAIYDEGGRATRAVGIVENIDRDKRMAQAFAQDGQYREALIASSMLAYDVNLTRDAVARISGSRAKYVVGLVNRLGESQAYSDFLHAAVETIVAPEDRRRFLRDMSLENLRKLYGGGVNEHEYEYRRITRAGGKAWTAAYLHMMPGSWDGDAICIIHYGDIQARKSLEESLQYRATRDSLTGLLNRETGERRIQEFLKGTEGGRGLHAFLMIDMDHFKKINDTYGHQFGDIFLTKVAETVSKGLRGGDIATRMGGDEFVVLVKNLRDAGAAMETAHRIAHTITECGREMSISFKTMVSIGVALAPRDGRDFGTLYRRADEAMYAAKRNEDIRIVLVGEAEKAGAPSPRNDNI